MDADEAQLDVIRRRYAKDGFNVVHQVPREILERRLSLVCSPQDFRGKRVMEFGAGCSPYLPLFLEYGCSALVANDLVPERLALNGIHDPRYSDIAGDLRTLPLEDGSFDVIFANLTVMFVIPMLDEVMVKLAALLRPGGLLINIDPNYLCPIALYRLLADRSGANPAKAFNPFTFRKVARRHGFAVDKMVPFTRGMPWADGMWLLGTSFAARSVRLPR